VLRQTSAVLLASGMRDVVGFTRSETNPADKASRDLRGWQRYRNQLRQASRRWTAAPGSQPSATIAALPSIGSGAVLREL
jgi:hypothetical protein